MSSSINFVRLSEKKNSIFTQISLFLTDFKGIKRIEIPSCESEPCVLHIGQRLPVKIIFEAGLCQKNI
jgi:hypothetical protein